MQASSINLTNFVVNDTNGPVGFPNGSVAISGDGLSAVITGSENGIGQPGEIDMTIDAIASSVVQFNWSYASGDPSSIPDPGNPQGCGAGFLGPCNIAGYLMNGTFFAVADDINQGSGSTTFTVGPGPNPSFGFEIETFDNSGSPTPITFSISNVTVTSADPVPEPGQTAVILMALIGVMVVARLSAGRIGAGVDA